MKMAKFTKIISISLLVALAGTLPAFAADTTDIYNLLNNTTNTYLNTIKNSVANTDSKVTDIKSIMNSYLPNLQSIMNYTFGIDRTLAYISDVAFESNGVLFNAFTNTALNTQYTNQHLTTLNNSISTINSDVHQLKEVLANSTDAAIRNDYQARVSEISNDFLSSNGDASVGLGDIGSSKQSVIALKDSLSGGASSSSLWSVLTNNSDGWGWFSQATMDDLDQTGSGNRRSSNNYEYLNDYYDQVYSNLGGDYND